MIIVREYAELSYAKVDNPNIDLQHVSKATFDWLLNDVKLSKFDTKLTKPDRLKLGSYVGYMESPSGEGIEILPKTTLSLLNGVCKSENEEIASTRKLLQDMLRVSLSLKPSETNQQASLKHANLPIHEWIFSQFLTELTQLIKRGIKHDYQHVQQTSKYLRGSLQVSKQINQPPHKLTTFHIKHHVFYPHGIENRLIKTALAFIFKHCQDSTNWRLANEYQHLLHDIPAISASKAGFKQSLAKWRSGKLLQHYQAILPWCRLILMQMNPRFSKGEHRGIALLFNMNDLFENYVGYCLSDQFKSYQVKHHKSNQYLVSQGHKQYFQLKPDFVFLNTQKEIDYVLDTKWKLLDLSKDKFNISQSDMYQMFAYGHKYLGGKGKLVLIYPYYAGFTEPLRTFSFSCNNFSGANTADDLQLLAVPFDLKKKRLILKTAEQQQFFNLNSFISATKAVA